MQLCHPDDLSCFDAGDQRAPGPCSSTCSSRAASSTAQGSSLAVDSRAASWEARHARVCVPSAMRDRSQEDARSGQPVHVLWLPCGLQGFPEYQAPVAG